MACQADSSVCSADGDDDDISQRVPLGSLDAGICYCGKTGFQVQYFLLLHLRGSIVLSGILSPPFRCDCPVVNGDYILDKPKDISKQVV